jgi:hypothetical protein
VLSIAGILQVFHKTDVEEKYGKGDYYRNAQNHPEECFSQGQKFSFRAGISAPGQNFWGPAFEIRLSPLQNIVVQRSVKGPEILIWQNFRGPEIS